MAESETPESAASPDAERLGPAWLPLAIAIALPVLFFFFLPPLTNAGLWDPSELNVADLARRIALNLHGASNLALEGADNSLPHLNDLGRPQLAFTSMALGFKLFGLHEWSGRAPLALWGILGVLATYGFVSRLVDRRAGVFSAVALTTMPLYFVQSRMMLGDIVTMSAFAMAFGGLAVATFYRGDDGDPQTNTRLGWLAIAVVGLLSGYFSRGAFIGVALPALGVGLAYVVAFGSGQRRFDGLAFATGAVSLGLGLSVAGLAINALADAKGATILQRASDLDPLIGAMIRPPTKYPTFDFVIGHVAEALAPWSAFAPFAFGRLVTPPNVRTSDAFARESGTRLALLIGVGVALMGQGWMFARTDLVAFAAPALIAAGCGIALRDYERGAHPSIAVGVGTGVLLGLLHHELHVLPEKAFNAFALLSTTFPESFKTHALAVWTIALVGFAGIAFLTFVERESDRTPFDPKGYLRVLIALRDAWDGMLALAYFAMVAGASLAGLVVWIGVRQHFKFIPSLSSQMRENILNAWWATALVPLAVIFGIYFWCDVWLWALNRATRFSKSSLARGFEPFEDLAIRIKEGRLGETVPKLISGKLVVTKENLADGEGPMALFVLAPLMYLQIPVAAFLALYLGLGAKLVVAIALALPAGVAVFLLVGALGELLRGSRSAFIALFGTVVGAVVCFSYYPALANQLSPKEVFESYRHLHKGNEPLALFGVGGRTAAYYAGGQPLILRDTNSAFEWLMGGDKSGRRFLAVRSEELARLNRAYREQSAGKNLPVLDARSSQIVLVTSALRDGEKNESPLNRYLLSSPPTPQRKLDTNLEDKLMVLGYDITDAAGRLADHIGPGKKYHMKTYFKVLAPVTTEWEMFIHIDGFHRRHNGDHKVCEGKYPMSLWLKDDIVVDDYEFTLEPNFSPGNYTNYFGLFVGESRMKVKSGPADNENRVNGGFLRVQ